MNINSKTLLILILFSFWINPEVSLAQTSQELNEQFEQESEISNEENELDSETEDINNQVDYLGESAPADLPTVEEESLNSKVEASVNRDFEKDLRPRGNINDSLRIYDKKEKRIKHPFARKGLYKITKDREYIYRTYRTSQNNAASVRFGMYEPKNLKTEDQFFSFQDLYEDANALMLLVDYEWQVNFLGRFGLKVGSGLFYAEGNGRFNINDPDIEQSVGDLRPVEDFTLFMLPNNIGVTYKLQFWDTQYIVPYAEGALDAYTLLEIQEGETLPKLGGSLGAHVSVGAALNLNWIDEMSAMNLDKDFGINNIYLTAELRNYFHITGAFDFSGTIFNAGFSFDF